MPPLSFSDILLFDIFFNSLQYELLRFLTLFTTSFGPNPGIFNVLLILLFAAAREILSQYLRSLGSYNNFSFEYNSKKCMVSCLFNLVTLRFCDDIIGLVNGFQRLKIKYVWSVHRSCVVIHESKFENCALIQKSIARKCGSVPRVQCHVKARF